MPADFCCLNLSNNDNQILAVEDVAQKLTGDPRPVSARLISSLEDIPDRGPLVLYVIGHAAPDDLFDRDNRRLPEGTIAKAIRNKRDEQRTLIIWDVCFAGSFSRIDDEDVWDRDHYVNIFACQPFERTWHDGRLSIFSFELAKVVEELNRTNGNWQWSDLQAALQARFAHLQTPTIEPQVLTPADFLGPPPR